MIPIDGNTPRALRDAAREYDSQAQWVADLKKAQQRERERFLEQATAGAPEREAPWIDRQRTRPGPSRK